MDYDLLHSILSYDMETGVFVWKVNHAPRAKIGNIAGYDNGAGYKKISWGGKKYFAHRLAFLYVTGAIPKVVDHINRNPSDNSWKNLRACRGQVQNGANKDDGPKGGVRLRYGNWYARYGHTHLGVFTTKEEAMAVRNKAKLFAFHGITDMTTA